MIKRMKAPAWLAGGAVLAVAAGCAPVVPVIGGSAVLGTAVFEERTTLAALNDTDIELGIANRLGNHSGELYRDVFVDVTEGAVVLTGSVPRPEDRVAATEAAWATPGVVSVEDALEVAGDGGTNAYFGDVSISNRLRFVLLTDPDIRSINYNVTTVDRTVHLTGLARSAKELQRVIDHAREVEGVRRVVSHVLTIDDPRRVARIARGG
ncbi:hypothetical protein LNKW23_34050 [Paralimibaculum aggregatum]|uniref:BON domain-containing protein n=1 Tax=Paralimibaculum aggregatum TaxID=3036245 RepID=A0ABQ6LP11_9RHOB|nr:BON domain-containing protein [Limibaculum sp. NKW23]GMG84191.1 hypothetical protein LNKW23_34050 [Limibaculum sp. NKW23]